ncbi:MAG: AAA family ATPase [Prevotella sp.]|nr:AAA family ATPase [Prevotella sp.]
MERTDFVETRTDVVKNIYTLYSYAKSNKAEDREWALERFRRGKWYVVEPFGNTLLFAPSRFVGYKDNTREKHTANHGDGTDTNDRFRELNLYKEMADDYLSEQFEHFMAMLGIEKDTAKFFIPSDWSVDDLKVHHKCYFICPTHCKGQKEEAWNSFLSQSIMAIGWNHTDYTDYTIDEINHEYRNDPSAIAPFTFMKQIREGDIVCCTNNAYGLWGIGVAMSEYKYSRKIHYAGRDDEDNDSHYSHYIDVAWLCFRKKGYIPLSDFSIRSPEKQWPPYGTLNMKEEIPQYIYDYLLKRSKDMESNNKYGKYIKLLEANKNLILTGAPGTGKTYMAKAIAEAMGAECDFVQFHPSYDYTDFVEGLRPTPPDRNGNIGFERKDGVFKAFCKKAIFPVSVSHEYNGSAVSFDEAYNILVDRIKHNEIVLYSDFRSKMSVMDVIIEKNDKSKYGVQRDIIRYSKAERIASIDYLQKIYNYYVSKNIFDIRNENSDQFVKIIGNTLDYSYYRGIVQGLLDLTAKGSKDESSCSNKPESEFEELKESRALSSNKPYIFIIDEINRGEISKIFGELFFCIDPGYRGKKGIVKTQYQNMITDKADSFYDGFYVPHNVYIIGTMNDIDRSVESMDFAMRRRFAWEEVKADENTGMLDELKEMKAEVVETMKRLNAAIWDEETGTGIEGFSAAYHIGGAYFSKLQLYFNEDHSNRKAAYRHLWENHLRGVLFEYLRGTAEATDNMRMLERVYYNGSGSDDIEG